MTYGAIALIAFYAKLASADGLRDQSLFIGTESASLGQPVDSSVATAEERRPQRPRPIS